MYFLYYKIIILYYYIRQFVFYYFYFDFVGVGSFILKHERVFNFLTISFNYFINYLILIIYYIFIIIDLFLLPFNYSILDKISVFKSKFYFYKLKFVYTVYRVFFTYFPYLVLVIFCFICSYFVSY